MSAAGEIVQRTECTTDVVQIAEIDLVYYFSDTESPSGGLSQCPRSRQTRETTPSAARRRRGVARPPSDRRRRSEPPPVSGPRGARARAGRPRAQRRTRRETLGSSPRPARARSRPTAAPRAAATGETRFPLITDRDRVREVQMKWLMEFYDERGGLRRITRSGAAPAAAARLGLNRGDRRVSHAAEEGPAELVRAGRPHRGARRQRVGPPPNREAERARRA